MPRRSKLFIPSTIVTEWTGDNFPPMSICLKKTVVLSLNRRRHLTMACASHIVNPVPPLNGMKMHRITSQGVGLRACESGGGLPLVFVHGMWCDHHMFDALWQALPPSLRLIALDLRGHGQSETPRRQWSVMDAARDIDATMETLALKQAVLIGHSLGGMAALRAVLDYPDRTSGLVLIGMSAEQETPERKSQLEALSLAIRIAGMRKWMVRRVAESFFSPWFRREYPHKVAAWRKGVCRMRTKALLQALYAVKERPSVMDRLVEIGIPVLVVCGANDTIADPAHAGAMARRLPGGDPAILPHTGHALPLEKPRELAIRIRQFVSTHHLSQPVHEGPS